MITISDRDFEDILFFIINSRSELRRVLKNLRTKGDTFFGITLAKEYIARAEVLMAQYDNIKEIKNEKK